VDQRFPITLILVSSACTTAGLQRFWSSVVMLSRAFQNHVDDVWVHGAIFVASNMQHTV
jgi:hypothetical protein